MLHWQGSGPLNASKYVFYMFLYACIVRYKILYWVLYVLISFVIGVHMCLYVSIRFYMFFPN